MRNITTRLEYTTVDGIGFDGLAFYVSRRNGFDVDDYAEHTGLVRAEIDPESIKSIVNAAADLPDDVFMCVKHVSV